MDIGTGILQLALTQGPWAFVCCVLALVTLRARKEWIESQSRLAHKNEELVSAMLKMKEQYYESLLSLQAHTSETISAMSGTQAEMTGLLERSVDLLEKVQTNQIVCCEDRRHLQDAVKEGFRASR